MYDTLPTVTKRCSSELSPDPRPHKLPQTQKPSRYWDSLSQVRLTRSALEELHRRSLQAGISDQEPVDTRRSDFCEQASPRLRRFARQGGPNLQALRGFSNLQAMAHRSRSRKRDLSSARITRTDSTSRSTQSSGPYSRNFQQKLVDGGVYPDGYEYPSGRSPPEPDNLEEIRVRLAQSRASLSPSLFREDDFKRFKRADAQAPKEKQVVTMVIPIIEGDIGDNRCTSGCIPFTNLKPLTDGTLAPGNPDIFYGARPEQLHPDIREQLGGEIIPSTQHDLPIVPNFVLAAKGPDGSLAVASRQACYDGTLGARAMYALESYEHSDHQIVNDARSVTSIYHGGQLKIFTVHPFQRASNNEQVEYAMHQLDTWGMTGSFDACRRGMAAYRNARDWAKEQRNHAINEANLRRAAKRAEDSVSQCTDSADEQEYFDATPATTVTDDELASHLSQSVSCKRPAHSPSASEDLRSKRKPSDILQGSSNQNPGRSAMR